MDGRMCGATKPISMAGFFDAELCQRLTSKTSFAFVKLRCCNSLGFPGSRIEGKVQRMKDV